MKLFKIQLFVKNVITASALASMLFQSALPFTYALPAYAQEATVTPTDTATPSPTNTVSPTDTPTSTPTDTITPTPTQDQVSPTPTDGGTPTITPTDTQAPTPTDSVTAVPTPDTGTPTTEPNANVNSQGPPSNNNSNNNSNNPTVTPTQSAPTPTVTPSDATDANGNLNTTVLKNVSAPSLDLAAPTSNGSATISTDKADYHPTDTAVISGSGFLPNKAYTLEITSTDAPAVDFTTVIQMTDQGAFVYAYQLDGNYRPNYTVYVKNGSNVVATTTFTDSNTPANAGSTFSSVSSGGGSVNWVNADASHLQTSDNTYATVSLDKNKVSDYIKATGFGFSVPAGSTINGIQVNVEKHTSGSDIRDNSVKLVKGGSIVTGTGSEKADTVSAWSGTDATVTYGAGTTDLWGTTWASTDINSSTFGVVFSAKNTSSSTNNEIASVDQITITVYYTEASVTPTPTATATPTPTTVVTPTPTVTPTPAGGNPATNVDQCQNGGVGNTVQPCSQTAPNAAASGYGYQGNANANHTNSHWNEGDFVPIRIIATNYSAGAGNIQFEIDTTKSSKHAYDYIGSFDATETTGSSTTLHANHNNPVGDIISGDDPTTPDSIGVIPAATLGSIPAACGTNTWVGSQVAGHMSAWGTSGPLTVTYVSENVGSSGNCSTTIQVAWGATQAGFGGTIVLAYGAHIATQGDWGTGNSAVSISGSPYHTSLVQYTTGGSTKGIGNQDTKLAADALIPASTLTINKTAVGGDSTFAYTTTETNSGTNLPSSFNITTTSGTGSQSYTTLTPGTYTVTETAPTGGWSLTNLICTASGTGSSVTPTSNSTGATANITIGSAGGANITCTYTNSLQATLTVNKVCSPSNDTGKFNLRIDGTTKATDAACGGTTGAVAVSLGQHTVSELGGTGTSLSNYTAVISGDCDANGNVTVAAGQNAVCTITNTRNTGTIEVKKVLSPTNDQGTFNLQVDGTTDATGGNGTTTNAVTVNTGSHSVAETPANSTVMANYTSSYVCTDNGNPLTSGNGTSVLGLTVNTGDAVVCTFTNTRNTVDLKVQKIVNDGSPLNNWAFSLDGANAISANVSTGIVDFGQVTTNVNHTITEGGANQSDYTLVSVTGTDCTANTDNSGNIISGTANIPNGGSGVTCVFTNNRNTGTIQVAKVVSPHDNGATSWDFSISGPSNNTVNGLHDGDTSSKVTSYTGNYIVTESGTNLSNYTTTSSCTDGTNTETNVGTSSALFTLMTGKNYVCTFTNTIKNGTIQVYKYNDLNANGVQDQGEPVLSGWTVNVSSNGAQFTDVNGLATFSNVLPGTYTLSETMQNGWFQSNISCGQEIGTDNDNSHPVTVTPGATTTCYIGNYQDATIHVTKVITDPDGKAIVAGSDTTTFPYAVGGSSDSVSLGNGDSHDYVVAPGMHTVTETLNTNYDFKGCDTGITSSNGTLVTVTSGQTLNVTCTNQQKKATINVNKVVVLSDGTTYVSDDHSFTAQLNGTNDQSFSESTPTSYSVNPGSSYTIGEAADVNYTQLGCKLDTGAAATNMTLTSNQTVTVTCTNEQNPGTISGYKFHADGVTGILGWAVNLYSCVSAGTDCNTLVANTTTDATGYYSFTNLISGFYQVAEVLNSAYTAVSDTFHNVTINPGTVSTDNNFANFKNINVTACKKIDLDGNLDTTKDQTNKFGWTVNLLVDGQVTDTKTTGDNGCYTWTNRGPNHDYGVSEATPSGWTALTDTSKDFGTAQDGVNDSYTFVNFQNVSISGYKFNDANGDKAWDNGELGLQGWTIDLENTNGDVLATTTTAADGSYSFSNLGPGTYRVREVGQAGWVQMTDNPSDITVSSGQDVTNIDFGNQGQGTVIVTKFLDDNANGTYDNGEQTLADWTMNLDQTGQATGKDGTTTFTNVPAGSHTLGETQQDGWNLSNIYCSNDPIIILDNLDLPIGPLVDTTNAHSVTVNPGDTIYCYVGNYQNASITVVKNVVNPDGQDVTDTSTSFDFTVTNHNTSSQVDAFSLTDNQSSNPDSVTPGNYDVNELLNQDNYTFDSCSAVYNGGNEAVGAPITAGENVTLGSGDSVTVTCVNRQKPGTVIVTKYDDKNGNGVQDEGEEVLSGWTMNLSDNGSQVTDGNGEATFNPVNPGTYTLSENIQSGWEQTNISCSTEDVNTTPTPTETPTPTIQPLTFNLVGTAHAQQELDNSNEHSVTVNPNQTVFCSVGNKNLIPVLTIAKTNNKLGVDQHPGDTVLYTITVEATQSAANNVTVTDLLPKGFVYQGGSWTANSDIRGDLKALGVTTEPTYHSPGTWQLGDMAQDETVTLTLLAQVSDVQPGDYKDVTWAQGTAGTGATVLALAQPTGYVDTNFVGTDVNVVNDKPVASFEAVHTQSVLGASTMADTGANVVWIDFAISLLLLGFASGMIGFTIRRKYND